MIVIVKGMSRSRSKVVVVISQAIHCPSYSYISLLIRVVHVMSYHITSQVISTPSLWQSPSTTTRPGDRMPGGVPADHAASSTTGNISLASGYEAARNGCASC